MLNIMTKVFLTIILFIPITNAQTNYWQKVLGSSDENPFISIVVHPNGTVYSSDYGSVYKSTDYGKTWNLSKSEIRNWITSLAINTNGDILAGGNGLFRSSDNGQTWDSLPCPLGSSENIGSMTICNNGYIFVGCNQLSGIIRSTDNGNNWEKVNSSISGSSSGWVNPMVNFTSGHLSVIAYHYGGVPGLYTLVMHYSTNYGETWSASSFPWKNTTQWGFPYTAIATDSKNRLYVSGSSYPFLARSSNEDSGWISLNYPSQIIRSIRFNKNGDLLVGTNDSGFYISTNGGINWAQHNSGLKGMRIRSLAVDSGGYIYAGTDSGVFKSMETTLSIQRNQQDYYPDRFSLNQNYPNPFNSSTQIYYELKQNGYATLTIYDVLGRVTDIILNQKKEKGVHQIHWDSKNQSSGIYFYRLTIQNNDNLQVYDQIKKMILIK